jgi:hypothetical protein
VSAPRSDESILPKEIHAARASDEAAVDTIAGICKVGFENLRKLAEGT